MADIGINLLSSAIAGMAVAVLSWLVKKRRADRMRSFFGVQPGSRPVLVVPQHHDSPNEKSVHLNAAASAVDLAATLMRCGAEPELVGQRQAPWSLGGVTEVCIGGPAANARVATHLRLLLPGVTFPTYDNMVVGESRFLALGDLTYALLAKVYGPQGGAPVFLVSGQWAADNRAAARYLARHHRDLARRYGPTGRFVLVLRQRGVGEYGNDATDDVTHVTSSVFETPERPGDQDSNEPDELRPAISRRESGRVVPDHEEA